MPYRGKRFWNHQKFLLPVCRLSWFWIIFFLQNFVYDYTVKMASIWLYCENVKSEYIFFSCPANFFSSRFRIKIIFYEKKHIKFRILVPNFPSTTAWDHTSDPSSKPAMCPNGILAHWQLLLKWTDSLLYNSKPNLAEMFSMRSYTRVVTFVQIRQKTWPPCDFENSDWSIFKKLLLKNRWRDWIEIWYICSYECL
jgi:hypothetical protein